MFHFSWCFERTKRYEMRTKKRNQEGRGRLPFQGWTNFSQKNFLEDSKKQSYENVSVSFFSNQALKSECTMCFTNLGMLNLPMHYCLAHGKLFQIFLSNFLQIFAFSHTLVYWDQDKNEKILFYGENGLILSIL